MDITKSFVLLMPVINAVYANILLFLLGYLLVGAGTGVYVATGYPKMPIDGLMWATSSFLRWSTNQARLLIEVVGFVTMLFVGNPFGLGTILIAFTIGNVIAISQMAAASFFLKNK